MGNPFSNLDDAKLMELYKSGENMAFEVIYSRHKDRVYSYLAKRLTNKNLIDDTFQNIFIKFHKSRSLFDGQYPLLSWIYTISRSELLDTVKKNKVNFTELKETHLITEETTEVSSLNLDGEKSLSEKEREAIKLRYFSDSDFKEISTILNTSEANSRKLVSRGLKKLRTKLLGETK